MAYLMASQRYGPGGPLWVRMFLWLGRMSEAVSDALASHTGQSWASPSFHDH